MVSLAPFVLRRPWLTKMLMPAASWYANAAGYRKLGLRYGFFNFPARNPPGFPSNENYAIPTTATTAETRLKQSIPWFFTAKWSIGGKWYHFAAPGLADAQPVPQKSQLSVIRVDLTSPATPIGR
ncbi:hypothetical protein LLEC1_02128 [Akanthomyces lecanii]|uniref:Complex III subunit 7 n=1 Tax=Cordyceps confragosa TaxID=2714763 RepID=A0A179I731_CORDF|nr:hypothetical protein LLEC1_02128 [Akanthomyces lecanii]